jgi:hypothetical protein
MKLRENRKVWVVGFVLVGFFVFGSLIVYAGKESFFEKPPLYRRGDALLL